MGSGNGHAADGDRGRAILRTLASARASSLLKIARQGLVAGMALCLLEGSPLMADGNEGNLVTATWLEAHRGDADVLVLDASPARSYAAQHIPGAVNADLLSYGVKEKPAAEMERLYESWGIRSGKKIVLYDQGGSYLATRVFFSLYYHGFPAESLLVLDGGLSKWQELGLPVTKDVAAPPEKGSVKLAMYREEARARLPEFLAASGDPANNALLEALGPDWHFGDVLAFERAGHIPHAILMPAGDFYNPDKTFKSPGEMRKMLAYLGVSPDQTVYAHCGGGVAASVPFFALRFMLGYPRVKLYAESQMGWLRDERELPYWTYDVPSLMRRANWLQSRGGRMLRMYGGADVSIVDVRPSAEFDEGHVPFALHLPADLFKAAIESPEKLAGLLGAAGVDASHEAVVVSGAGLTRDAALAFVLLESLGQRKVSVLMDSMAEWARLGFAVTKAATVAGQPKSPQDAAVLPTTYSAKPREHVIIAEKTTPAEKSPSNPTGTQGLFPKVFVASGENLPAKAPKGKVVHVPYTSLLNADGTPKAAKDLWNILAKAGVPRYAELVCYSDDPGEAAANYFLLKLMGYPDIKVLVPPITGPAAR